MANSNQISDAFLVQNYINGDESALSVLLRRHQTKLYSFIYSKVHDRDLCEDIFQDTFIKVIQKLKSGIYNEEGKFLPWVMRISHNLIIDNFRRNKKMPLQRDDEMMLVTKNLKEPSRNAEDSIFDSEIEIDLKKIIEKLPTDQKQIVQLRYFEELSFKEIAEQEGISINTALGRMRYAVINMRKMIDKNNMVFLS